MSDAFEEEEPAWQPVGMVAVMTEVVVEQLAFTRQQLAMLGQARPGMLDDHTVVETLRVYGERAEDYKMLFAEQGRRWQAEQAPAAVRARVGFYVDAVGQHRQVLAEILALAEYLKGSTIEAIMVTPDAVLGLRHLSGTGVYGSFTGPATL